MSAPRVCRDFAAWARRPGWTTVEAAALLYGLDPRATRPGDSDYFWHAELSDLRAEMELAVKAGTLATLATLAGARVLAQPCDVLDWAEQTGITVPPELAEAVTSFTGRAAERERLIAEVERLRAENEQLKARLAEAELAAEPIDRRERDTLLLVVAELARDIAASHANCRRKDGRPIFSSIEKRLRLRRSVVARGLSESNIESLLSEAEKMLSQKEAEQSKRSGQ